ncbi:MAG: hypothetical protein ACYC6Z_06965 [Thermoleophilia bacterium]
MTVVVFLSGCNSGSGGSSGTAANPTITNTSAATIAFGGLTGNGSPVTEYDESGFSISSNSGNWEVMAEYGKPAPAIVIRREAKEPESQGEIEVTDAGGAVFRFTSVDLYSSITPIPYTIKGYRDSELVFNMSDTVPNTYGNFAVVANPDAVLIDRLTISVTNPETPCCSNPVGIDNIRFNQEARPQKTGGSTAPGAGFTMTSATRPPGT